MQKCFYHHHLLSNWSLHDSVLSAQVTKTSVNLDLCSKEPFSSSGRPNIAQKYPLQQEDQGPHQVGATVVSIRGIYKRGDIKPPGGIRSLDVKRKPSGQRKEEQRLKRQTGCGESAQTPASVEIKTIFSPHHFPSNLPLKSESIHPVSELGQQPRHQDFKKGSVKRKINYSTTKSFLKEGLWFSLEKIFSCLPGSSQLLVRYVTKRKTQVVFKASNFHQNLSKLQYYEDRVLEPVDIFLSSAVRKTGIPSKFQT